MNNVVYAVAYFRPSWNGQRTQQALQEMPIRPNVFVGDWNVRFRNSNRELAAERHTALSEFIVRNKGYVITRDIDAPDHAAIFDIAVQFSKQTLPLGDHKYEYRLRIPEFLPATDDDSVSNVEVNRFCTWELGSEAIAELFAELLQETFTDICPELCKQEFQTEDIAKWLASHRSHAQEVIDTTDAIITSVFQSVAEAVLGSYDPNFSRRQPSFSPEQDSGRKYSQEPIHKSIQAVKKTLRNASHHFWTSTCIGESPHQSAFKHFSKLFQSGLTPERKNDDIQSTTPSSFLRNFDHLIYSQLALHLTQRYFQHIAQSFN